MKKSFNSKFFRVLLMLFMLLSFSFSALAENIPANTTLYLDAGEWNKGGAGFAAYFFDNGEEWVSMTQVSGNIFKVTSPNKNFPKVIFARMNSANATGWGNKWNQTKDITDYTSGKNLCTITDHWNGNKASWIWSTYSAEDTGEGGGGSSTSLPTSKGDCQKIEIYSKDNYRLYVFDGSHVGPEWGSTEKGAQVEYDGSTYYKWTICSQDKIQIIFQNGDRSKQSGDSPVLYGGYAYFFENVEVVVNGNSNPVPKPTAVKAVDCTTSGTCYNSSGVDEDINVPELPTGLLCDATYKKTLFFEDFGTLAGEKSRKQNNTVDAEYNQFCGAGEGFVTSYNFVDECVSIKNAGEYAIVVNPKYSGCSSKNDKDYNNPCYCGDSNTGKLWYKDCLDHTEGDVNGGMLQFDSRDGNSKDVLYQRTLKNVCANTFLNFSAWITKANNTDADPIKARFILRRGGADGEPIGKKDIDNINLNDDNINLDDGWLQISAMFNTGDLNDDGEITVQLINLAKYGQNGNDILLDDLELSACLPLAKLVCSDGVSVEKTIDFGETEVLTASIENGILENPYYYWQYKTARSLWQPFFDEANQTALAPTQGLDKMQVKPEESSVQYRVIIANSAEEAMSIASEREFSDDCSIGAITNEVTITTIKNNLELDASITDGDICVDGVDATTLTLTVKNPRLVDVTDVKVSLVNIDNLNISKVSGTGSYDNGVWEVGDLTTEATVSIVLSVKSSTSVSAQISKTIGAYVSAVDSETYASIDVAKSKTTTTIKLNPIPDAPAVTPYSECATSGTVALSTLASGTSLKFYSDEALSAPVTDPFSASTVVTNKEYYVTQTNTYGCTSPAATVTVTVKENPTLSAATLNKTAICATDANSKATLTYNISGGLAPYTLYIDRTEGGVTETINENVSGSGTRDLKPSSDATYKFTKVVDANGCESTLNKTVYIDVQEIKVTSNISDEGVCADKQIEYNITATGDNINYKWFESTDNGVSFNEVGTNSNTYTTDKFAMGDTKQYKVVVSQNSKVCSAVEGLSKVKVNDCSGFEITYKAETNNVVCEGGIIKLKLTLTNNSTENASDVQVLITNIANQTIVSRNTNLGASYTHDTGMWIIPSLASGATATLTLEIEGVTIVKDLESKAYVVRSGSTTYTEATTKALATQKITVKDITAPPTLIPETYKGCPVEEMLDLSTQVSSDDTNLKFYTTETGSVTATRANKNTIGTTSYWVSNTKEGECESPRTKLDITVYPQPTATISGTTAICKGESTDLSIALTGTEKYNIVLSSGDGKSQVTGSSTTIAVSPTETTPYTLTKVEDGNGCPATLSGSATITVNDKPAVEVTQNPTQNVCDGDALTLPSVSVDANGSTVTSTKWYFNGKEYNEGDKVEYSDAIAEQELTLEYEATNSCGSTKVDAGKFIIRPRPELVSLEITDDDNIICEGRTTTLKATFKGTAPFTFYVNGEEKSSNSANWSMTISEAGTYTISSLLDKYCAAVELTDNVQTLEVEKSPVVTLDASDVTLNCTTPTATITASGGAYRYEWQDDKGSPVKTGDKLLVAQTDVAKPEFTTTYTVYGYSEKANCKSKYAITLTVKEDFVKPIVEITAPTDILTCTQTSIDLTVDATNNTENIVEYIWDGGAASSASTYQITSPGKHTLMVKGENGCSSDEATKNITQNINKPEISIKSYNSSLEDASAGRTETKIITCTDSKLYLETIISKITDSNKVGYLWNNGDVDFSTEVSSAGTYTVTVTDKLNGCSQSASIEITKDENAANITEISSVTTLDEESEIYVETTELTCSITSLILNPIVTNVTSASYEWSKFDKETGKYNKIGEDKTQTVTEEGIYKLVITDENTGCPAEKEVTITQNIKKPEISIKSYNLPITDTSGKRVETQIVTCSDSKLYLETTISKITDSGKIGYMWSNGSEEFSTEVSSAGTYTVTVTDKANGCTQSASIEITKDNNAATISKISSVTTLDESSEIYAETTELTCSITSLILNPTVTNVTSASYEWSKLNKETGEYNKIGSELTQTITEKGDYKFVVIDNSTGCPTEEEVTITENKRTPIIEDIISVNSTDKTAEGYLETQVINCRDKELFISSVIKDKVETQYSPEELKYDWTVSYDDGEIFEAYGEAATISTTSKAIFRLVVTDKVTGCPAVADTIIIKENIVKPVISYIESYETINPTGTGIKEEDVLTCKKPVIYLRPTIEESTDVSYKWSDDSTEDYLKVVEQGTYGLVVKDNTSFCSSDEVTFSVTENKRTPIIEDIISVNSTDETVEGYKETQIINCKDTELFIKATIVDNVQAGYSPEGLTYDWTYSEDGDMYEAYGTGETTSTTTEGFFRLVVTDKETGCTSAATTIEIKEVKTTPVITMIESVSTIDPAAEEVVKTNELTCDYPVLYLKPTIQSENEVSYKWNDESTLDYLKVEEKGTYTLIVKDETTFCSSEVYSYDVSENKNAPVLDIQSVYELCPSDTLSAKTLSSLLPKTSGITYKFYDESDVEIADLYKTSTENYYVVGVSENGCESNKTLFSVDLAKNVDFTLQASQTSMLVGGNETVITIIPDADSDEADTYTWQANGNEIAVDGLEYSTNLYLDTQFEVTAINRCDSKSQEVSIEVLWPTAFTPHNDNGKNDDFAKGMPIIVFNRFYTKIFEGPDGWDGTINGTMNDSKNIAVPGVYYYKVDLPNGEVKKGTIEIVR